MSILLFSASRVVESLKVLDLVGDILMLVCTVIDIGMRLCCFYTRDGILRVDLGVAMWRWWMGWMGDGGWVNDRICD